MKYRELLLFVLVMSIILVCWYIGGKVMMALAWAVSLIYATYDAHYLYSRRKRYYFVSFFADGKACNAGIAVRHSLRFRKVEDYLSEMSGAKSTIIMSFRRISEKQYDEIIKWDDNRKKD